MVADVFFFAFGFRVSEASWFCAVVCQAGDQVFKGGQIWFRPSKKPPAVPLFTRFVLFFWSLGPGFWSWSQRWLNSTLPRIGVIWLGSQVCPIFRSIVGGEQWPTLFLGSGCRFRQFCSGVGGKVFECCNFIWVRMFGCQQKGWRCRLPPPKGSVCGGFYLCWKDWLYLYHLLAQSAAFLWWSDARSTSKKRRHS